jgi:hypothetical protein
MNKRRSLELLLAGIFAILITGCAALQNMGQPEVVGTWTNAVGTVWTLRPDGMFEVDLTKDGKRDAWGTYTVEGDTITLQGTGGLRPKGCRGKGVYKFKRDGDNLRFTLVKDACKLRKQNVLMPWRAK